MYCFDKKKKQGKIEQFTEIYLSHLKNVFEKVLENASSEVLEQHVRAAVLYVIGSIIMPAASRTVVSFSFLYFLKDINQIKDYAWGAALLAQVYDSMKSWLKKRSGRFVEHFFSLIYGKHWLLFFFFLNHWYKYIILANIGLKMF
jgi:hypothetical protein